MALTLPELSSQLEFRSASAEDAQAVLEQVPAYHARISGAACGPDAGRQTLETLPPFCPRDRKHVWKIIWKAQPTERVVGLLDVIRDYPEPGTAFLGLLAIPESIQKQGLGTAILRRLEEKLQKEWGARRIRLAVAESNPVELFWSKQGFVRTGELRRHELGSVRCGLIPMDRAFQGQRRIPRLSTARLTLRPHRWGDRDAVLDYLTRNRAFHAPFEPSRAEAFYTSDGQEDRIRRTAELFDAGSEVRFLLFAREDDQPGGRILGTISATQLLGAPCWSAWLGYGLDQGEQGKGLMQEAVAAVVEYLFSPVWNLHRLQAGHVVGNAKSARVLEACGFQEEGLAREYLWVGGRFQDHRLTARLNPAWRPPPS